MNEVRNRVAHGGRIFNRSFRSATGIKKYQIFRTSINKHKSLDVYIFLFFMLNRLEQYNSMQDFLNNEIETLFIDFKQDKISNIKSYNLIKKYKKQEFENIKKVILKKMSV